MGMEAHLTNPSFLWTLINLHLTKVIDDCNSILNPSLELAERIENRLNFL